MFVCAWQGLSCWESVPVLCVCSHFWFQPVKHQSPAAGPPPSAHSTEDLRWRLAPPSSPCLSLCCISELILLAVLSLWWCVCSAAGARSSSACLHAFPPFHAAQSKCVKTVAWLDESVPWRSLELAAAVFMHCTVVWIFHKSAHAVSLKKPAGFVVEYSDWFN